MWDVISFGEILIDFLPLEANQDLFHNPGFQHCPGGAPANVAVGLARLGGKAAFMGQVGQDLFGDYLTQVLRQEAVDTALLCSTDTAPTGLAIVSLDGQGERRFSFYRNPCADSMYAPSQLPLEQLQETCIFHYGSLSLIQQPSRSATLKALGFLQSADVLLSYDPNLRLNLWPSASEARKAMLQGLRYANLVKVSEEELVFLTGLSDLEMGAEKLRSLGPEYICVTRGAKGVYYQQDGLALEVPAPAVEAIDTTGAGDAFVAGLLYQWSRLSESSPFSEQIPEMLRFANAVGALATTAKGAMAALPRHEQLVAIL